MEVKGTAIKTTRDFVKSNFPEKYSAWLNSLSPASKALYEGTLDATGWYALDKAYTDPMQRIVEMFYGSNPKAGGEALGMYSADVALKGFYKVFLVIASPSFLMQRATKIFTTFYQPSTIVTESLGPNSAVLKILKFEGIDAVLEYRIAGWILKALEFVNCREPAYQIKSALSRKDPETAIVFTWK